MPVHNYLVQIFRIDANAIYGVLNAENDKPVDISIRIWYASPCHKTKTYLS